MNNYMEEHLYLIDESKNQRKYYDMLQVDEKNFIAFWGRIGKRPQCKVYELGLWHKKLFEKEDKGYEHCEYSMNDDFDAESIIKDFEKGLF